MTLTVIFVLFCISHIYTNTYIKSIFADVQSVICYLLPLLSVGRGHDSQEVRIEWAMTLFSSFNNVIKQ